MINERREKIKEGNCEATNNKGMKGKRKEKREETKQLWATKC